MGRSFKRYHPTYRNREREVDGSRRHGPAQKFAPTPRSDPELVALAASAQVPVTRVETGKRTLTDKQIFLAVHATDSYQFDMRHFVGEMQAKLGMRSPRPVEPKPVVEKTADEIAAEREVFARRNWGRYWARKRRQDSQG